MAESAPVTGIRKKGGKRVFMALVGLLGMAAAGYFLKDTLVGPASVEAERELAQEAASKRSYVALEPPFIVNLRHEPRERLLRVSISLLVQDEAVASLMDKNKPMIRNGILLVLAAQDPKSLLTAEGKAGLQKALLEKVRALQNGLHSAPDAIEDLFFTDFVMQ